MCIVHWFVIQYVAFDLTCSTQSVSHASIGGSLEQNQRHLQGPFRANKSNLPDTREQSNTSQLVKPQAPRENLPQPSYQLLWQYQRQIAAGNNLATNWLQLKQLLCNADSHLADLPLGRVQAAVGAHKAGCALLQRPHIQHAVHIIR
jgi:hypothetical protein